MLDEQSEFIQAINDAYLQFEADRRMLERDLELTAQQLLEINTELSRVNRELEMRVAARTAELSSNEARFRGLFEYAPVSIWEEDFSAVRKFIDHLSKAGVNDFSAHFNEHPEDRAKVERTINQALDIGMEFWSKEYRFQRVDGQYADIMDRAYILRNEAGKPYRMIGAMIDITERKQAEMALQEANENMAHSLRELELRNQEIALLNKMIDLLQGSISEKDAHAIIGEAAKGLFPGTSGALYLFNNTHTLVNVAASWGNPPPIAQTFTPDDCWALRRGQTHQLYEEEDAKPLCRHILEPPPAITFCLPMVAQGEILGVLHLHSAFKDNLTEPKRQLIYTVAEQAGMALSNLKLREALREQSIRLRVIPREIHT